MVNHDGTTTNDVFRDLVQPLLLHNIYY